MLLLLLHHCDQRLKLLEDISNAHSSDRQLLYRLIKKQRGGGSDSAHPICQSVRV
jgi:hypothetical protein